MKHSEIRTIYSFAASRFVAILLVAFIILGLTSSCAEKDESVDSAPQITDSFPSSDTVAPAEPIIESTTSTSAAVPSEPVDAINPLTGIADMRIENVGMRSVGIVVNNHIASIPQRGLHRADVIYEYETEGGQTRLLAMFADISTVPEIGSLRSARIISSDLCAGTNSVYIHFGSNVRVPNHLKQYGIEDIDGNVLCAYSGKSVDGQITLSKNLFFYRDDTWKSKRAIEHTAVTNGTLLLGALEYKNIPLEGDTPVLFNFVESASSSLTDGTACTDLNVYFSATNKDSNFVYDKEILMYTKYQYNGTAQIDEITGEMIFVKNVFVLFANIQPHGDSTLDAYLEEGGDGYYVSEGKIINITWEKDSTTSLIEIFDENGKPVQVNAGRSYINVVRESRASQTTWK